MADILVIDDEESIALMITMALARYGFNVKVATDGIEGIKKFDEGRFDLVVTDIRMPGRSGNFVVKYIRNSGKNFTPVVGISGTPWLLEDVYFDAVLAKPFKIKDLIDTVSDLTVIPIRSIADR